MNTANDAIASRVLTCKLSGHIVNVTVYLGRPFEEDGSWVCEYSVLFPGGTRIHSHKILGEDSMQALQLAIPMLGSTLLSLKDTSDWRWNGQPYTGLPKSIEDPILGGVA